MNARVEAHRPSRRKQVPLVFPGAASHWPAMTRWSFDSFAKQFGDQMVEVAKTPDRLVLDKHGGRVPRVTMRLADYIGHHLGNRAPDAGYYYLSKCRIEDLSTVLVEDLDLGSAEVNRADEARFVWLAPRGAVTPLHWDLPDNTFVQIVGRKKWRIFAPGQGRVLYPHARLSRGHHVSRVDAARPDRSQFPRFPAQPDLEFVLNPGDVLCLPGGWWHHVEAMDASISFNTWRMSRFRACRPDIAVSDWCANAAIALRRYSQRLKRP